MSFLAAQGRLNASVMNRLRNVTVLIGGVPDVPGIFANPSANAALGVGMADTKPVLQLLSTDVTDNPVGSIIEIDGTPYVVGDSNPTGTGFTVLQVERTE
jgi:hypothetical protein